MHRIRSVLGLTAMLLFTVGLQASGVKHRMQHLPPFPDPTLDRLIQRAIKQMDGFHGDSAMRTINAALVRIDPGTRPEERHYFLAYRAEVLYYEGLFNEAMRDLDEAERIAFALKDSTLIANAFNLKGLLHENIQDSRKALPYLRLALDWFPNRPASRYPITEIFHIHGNLGSYLTTLGRLDSARFHLETSLQRATELGAQRAMAVAWWGLGNLEIIRGAPETALLHYERSWAIADSAKDHDIGVDAWIGRGLALAHAQRRAEAVEALDLAQAYLEAHRNSIGLVTQRNFARLAAKAYQLLGAPVEALESMAIWHRIDSSITANNIRSALATQAQLIEVDHDLEVERLERSNMATQLATEQRTRQWIIIASVLALFAITVIYLVNSSRQHHKRRLAEVEAERTRQERTIAELRVREQVSRDLHDDLGVGLSALKLRSEMSLHQDPASSVAPLLREQASSAEELIVSMRDIIWALQDDQGSLDDLVAYIGPHARRYLDAHGIALVLAVDQQWPALQLTTQQRRNIFLITKEGLHNVVKHAQARQVKLTLRWDRGLELAMQDDGLGLPPDRKRNGHGLVNMEKRAQQVGATLSISVPAEAHGTRLSLFVPFERNKS
ncbi:MAG: tetratricopeptide repeat-containing sensor histidine kinase [Flavobacteriales bacterium]